MPIFGKGREKFDFYILIHSLAPFPSQFKNLHIIWQRGSGRRGQTKGIGPTAEPGRSWATFQFEEAFHVDCALSQDPKTGVFEKKWLILAIMDGEKGAKASKEPLGRVVINLADYAAEDDKATMAFTVAANQAISQGVGECKMLITLGSRSKGKAPMALGGKTVPQSSPQASSQPPSSIASSEVSDNEPELSLKVMLPSAEEQRNNPDWRRNIVMPESAARQQHAAKSTGKVGGNPNPRRSEYDEDGFLIDEDDSQRGAQPSSRPYDRVLPLTGSSNAPASRPATRERYSEPAPADSASEADSDDFLAEAAAAMEGKGPMPVAPSLSRQQTRESAPQRTLSSDQRASGSSIIPPPVSEAALRGAGSGLRGSGGSGIIPPPVAEADSVPLRGSSSGLRGSGSGIIPPPVSEAPAARAKPIFALKPEGSRLRSPVVKPVSGEAVSPRASQSGVGVTLPAIVRKETRRSLDAHDSKVAQAVARHDVQPGKESRSGTIGPASALPALAVGTRGSGGAVPSAVAGGQGSADILHDWESKAWDNADRAAAKASSASAIGGDLSPRRPKKGTTQYETSDVQARPAGRLARDVSIDPATNPFADGPARVASGRRSAEGGEFEDALALNVGAASDRAARRPGQSRTLASGGSDSPRGIDSPRRRKLLSSREEPAAAEVPRASAVVLPSAISTKKVARVAAPPDNLSDTASPVKASGAGRHWLDEPEDLGVEPSPPSSPLPAYKAVQPVFLPKKSALERLQQSSSPHRSKSPEPIRALTEDQYRSVPLSNPPAASVPLAAPAPPAAAPILAPTYVPSPTPRSPPAPVAAPPPPPAPAPPPPVQTPPPAPTAQQAIAPQREAEPPMPAAAIPVQLPTPPPVRTVQREAEPLPAVSSAVRPTSLVSPASPFDDTRAAEGSPAWRESPVVQHSRAESAAAGVSGDRRDASSEGAAAAAAIGNGDVHHHRPSSEGLRAREQQAEIDMYTKELRAVAALEASIYLVRSGKPNGVRVSSKARNVHAPARRVARTIISLGPSEGTVFGLRALRAIEAAADAASDISGQAYWWSNCIQLRWMLWAMCNAAQEAGDSADEGVDLEPDSEEFDWVMQVLVPPLRELEAQVFQQLFQYMWSSVLMEGATADQLPGAVAKQWIMPPSKEEESVQRWIDAFQTVHRALLPAGNVVTAGHVSLLKHKMLTALMRRLDASLFGRLLAGDSSGGTLPQSNLFFSGWNSRPGSGLERELPLDSRTLPFELGGELTFGVGVNLKMAATRWTNWAADIGLRNDKGSPEEGYLLFPKLRATADLLMMPKEVLTDRAIRSEVIPGLPLSVICELLTRFRPDELANEPLQPGLLEALQSETPGSERVASPTSRGLTGYEPPSETALLADGLIDPVSLEFDDESEDELESLAGMYDPDKQGHTSERFRLLRELWASAR